MEPSNNTCLPSISCWEDFTYICGVASAQGNGEFEYNCTAFILVEIPSGTMWYGSLPIPNRADISLEQAIASLARVPDDCIYPQVPANKYKALGPLYYEAEVGTYFKGPKFVGYCNNPGGTQIGESLLEEARVLEILDNHPHPNIAEYVGCVIKEGRLYSVATKKYKMTLHARCCEPEVKDNMKKVGIEACIRDIAAGLNHLHGLGYAHNDINPYNIVVDDDDNCIIIDFGACKKLGDGFGEVGMVGFSEEFDSVSSVHNDEYGLQRIKEWLESQ